MQAAKEGNGDMQAAGIKIDSSHKRYASSKAKYASSKARSKCATYRRVMGVRVGVRSLYTLALILMKPTYVALFFEGNR